MDGVEGEEGAAYAAEEKIARLPERHGNRLLGRPVPATAPPPPPLAGKRSLPAHEAKRRLMLCGLV